MSIGKIIVILLVVVLIAAGIGWYTGIIKVGSDGVSYDANEANKDTTLDFYSKGSAAFQALQYDSAIENYTKAIKEKPDDSRAPAAYFAIATSYRQTKKAPEAIAAYEAFIEKFPNDSRITPAKKELELLKNMNP